MASVQNRGRPIIITTAGGPATVAVRRARAWLTLGWTRTTADLIADTRLGLRKYEREPLVFLAWGAARGVAIVIVWALSLAQWAVWTPARLALTVTLTLAAIVAASI